MRDTKAQRVARFYESLKRIGVDYDTADKLRRIEKALSNWDTLECGTGEGQVQRSIERDEETGKPFYRVQYPLPNGGYHDSMTPTADREAQALKRLEKVMVGLPHLVAYHQSDPRGPSLYLVPKERLTDGAKVEEVYTRGVAVCID